jgi:hypothetical protein
MPQSDNDHFTPRNLMTVNGNEGEFGAGVTESLPPVAVTANGVIVGADAPEPRFQQQQQPAAPQGQFISLEEHQALLGKVRAEEKDKIYPELNETKAALADIRRRLEAEDAEKQRLQDEADAKLQAEVEAKQTAEERLQAQIDAMKAERETERQERDRELLIAQKNAQFAELDAYRTRRISEESDEIIPELLELVRGESPEEIEDSLRVLRDKSAAIFEATQAATQALRQNLPGTRVTSPGSGPLENESSTQQLSLEDIRDMSFKDWGQIRGRLLKSSGSGVGMYG